MTGIALDKLVMQDLGKDMLKVNPVLTERKKVSYFAGQYIL